MSGRRARQERALERQRLEKILREADQAEPELVEILGDVEAWKVGPALIVVPTIRDDWPDALKAAIDLRRRASLAGRCDCGARRRIHDGGLVVAHEHGCPAGDEQLHAIATSHGMHIGRWT